MQHTCLTSEEFTELGRFDTAVQMFKTAATEYAFYKDSSYLRSTVAFIALSLALGGQTDSANLVRNQNVFMQNRESPVFYYTVLARIAFANGDLLQAESCLDSARYFIKKKSDPTAIALNCYYRAVLALSKKQYNESLVLLDSALQYLDNSPERFRRWKILSGLAAVYFCTNDSGAGFRYYNRAKECAPAGVTVPVIDEFKNCSYRP